MPADIMLGTKAKDRRHNNPGRGQYEADIDFVNDPAEPYYQLFGQVCQDFTYHEMNALRRALDLNIRTIYRWKNKGPSPKLDTILLVLNWHKAGKPITVRSQTEIAASMRPRREQS